MLGLIPAIIFTIVFFFRPSAIEAGDIKLFGIVGLAVGLPQTIVTILISGITSLIWIVIVLRLKKQDNHHIPLAPFITMGLFFTVFIDYKQLLLIFL